MKMTFSLLEDKLLHEVIRQPRSLTELLDLFVGKRGVSRAGFYKALASLKRKEVIVEHDRIVSANKIWLAESFAFFQQLVVRKAEPSYLARQIVSLSEGEDLRYTFRSVAEIDLFLINVVYDLLLLEESSDVLIEEQHEFFLLLNRRRTDRFLDELRPAGQGLYLLLHSASAIDAELVKRELAEPGQGYVTGTDRIGTTILHSIGDVLIELRLDAQFASALDQLYRKHDRITRALRDAVEDLTEEQQRHRIRIYKDPSFAKSMRTRFRKYFAGV